MGPPSVYWLLHPIRVFAFVLSFSGVFGALLPWEDRMITRRAAALCIAFTAVSAAQAQQDDSNYPSRAVKLVVPFPAGGGVDAVARIVAEQLRVRLGQSFVIENRSGASGNVGAEAVYSAEPDGYTLLSTSPPPLATNMSLFRKLNFDPMGFTPVVLLATSPNVLAVRTELPVSSAKDLIEFAKANPDKLNYASQGHGTTSHLTTEMFELATGTQMVHVPFKGTAPALNGLLTNSVDLMFVDLAAAVPLFEAGNLKILAVATEERLQEIPSIPTLEEVGLTAFRSTTWNGIVGPPKTSPAVVAKVNAAVNAVLTSPEIKDSFGKLRLIPLGGSPQEMAAFVDSERARWAHIIKAAKVTLD